MFAPLLLGLAGRHAVGFHSRNLSPEPLSVVTLPVAAEQKGTCPSPPSSASGILHSMGSMRPYRQPVPQLLSSLGEGNQRDWSLLSLRTQGPGWGRVGPSYTPPLPPAQASLIRISALAWATGASHSPAGLCLKPHTPQRASEPSGAPGGLGQLPDVTRSTTFSSSESSDQPGLPVARQQHSPTFRP